MIMQLAVLQEEIQVTKGSPLLEKERVKASRALLRALALRLVASRELLERIPKGVPSVSTTICLSVRMQLQVRAVAEADMYALRQIASSLMLSALRMRMKCLNRQTDRNRFSVISPRMMQSSSSSFVVLLE